MADKVFSLKDGASGVHSEESWKPQNNWSLRDLREAAAYDGKWDCRKWGEQRFSARDMIIQIPTKVVYLKGNEV